MPEKTKSFSRGYIVAFILALMPIMDPYIFGSVGGFEIHVMDFLLTLATIYAAASSRRVVANKDMMLFLIVLYVLNFLSMPLNALSSPDGSVRILILWGFYTLIFCNVFSICQAELLRKAIYVVGFIATVFLLVQYVFVSSGFPVWDGRIEVLELSKYDGWAKLVDITGAVRVHSLFQEPSYYCIYMIPIFADALIRKKYVPAAVFAVGVIASTSTIGIAGLAVGVLFKVFIMICSEKGRLDFRPLIAVIVVAIVLLCIIVSNDFILEQFQYTFNKVLKIPNDLSAAYEGSTKVRLLGNVRVFDEYSVLEKIVGSGIGQYFTIYASEITYPYSSSLVNFLLYSGLCGVAALMVWLTMWFKKACKEARFFIVLLLLIIAVDQIAFNYFFFYLVMWVFISDGELWENRLLELSFRE